MTALHWAAMNGDAEMAQMLVYAGANVKATTRIGAYTPLFLAARQGKAAAIPVLVKAGADPKQTTATGTTPLMVAAASGSTETVAALLDAGVDVNGVESVRGLRRPDVRGLGQPRRRHQAAGQPRRRREGGHQGRRPHRADAWRRPGLQRRQPAGAWPAPA